MMKKNKASALIVAIMISMILIITSTGFMYITNWTTESAKTGFEDNRLYWAAESGANHALRWIKRLRVVYFSDHDEAEKARDYFNEDANKVNAFSMYSGSDKINVHIDMAYNRTAGEWSVTSTANKDGKNSIITLSKIKAVSIAQYAFGWSTNMTDGTRFLRGDVVDGEIYSGGMLNLMVGEGYHPDFRSKVSIANTAGNSYLKSGEFSGSEATKMLNWLKNADSPKPGDFATGLQLSNAGNTPDDQNEFEDIMDDTFQKGIELVDYIDPQKGVCYEWSKLVDTSFNAEELSIYKLGSDTETQNIFNSEGAKIKIKYSVNNSGVTTANIYSGASLKKSLTIGTGAGKYNTILIPACDSNDNNLAKYSYVEVEGELAADASVVTEKNDIVITNDIKYKNIRYDRSESQIQAEIKNETNTPKFSLIAGIGYKPNSTEQYKGDILVNPGNNFTGTLYCSATIFTPKGVFSGFGINYPEYHSQMNYNFTFKNFGSLIMEKKGYWHMHYPNYNLVGDITPKFYDDLRYKDFNTKPLVYVPSVGYDIINRNVNIINGGYEWSVSYN